MPSECKFCGARSRSGYEYTALSSTCMHNYSSYEPIKKEYPQKEYFRHEYPRYAEDNSCDWSILIETGKQIFAMIYFVYSGQLYRYFKSEQLWIDIKALLWDILKIIGYLLLILIQILFMLLLTCGK